MKLTFSSTKLQKNCNSEKESDREWGKDLAKKVRQRLYEMRAASTLADLGHLPPARCHPLKGNRKGQFAVDLSGNWRMIFVPFHNPLPYKKFSKGEELDLERITDIQIIEIEDYHGK